MRSLKRSNKGEGRVVAARRNIPSKIGVIRLKSNILPPTKF